jgi:transcriptional regulator GlxA family with amidase domain
MRERLTIAFVLFSDVVALNLTGPAEVFSRANQTLKGPFCLRKASGARSAEYKLLYLSETGGPIHASSGFVMQTQAVSSIDVNRLDTLIVVGGLRADAFTRKSRLVSWIREASRHARRTCSVCNGAFLLAAAGLLDGRRAVAHWCEVATLQAMYPKVHVESKSIYIQDGSIWTSAGMTAGVDLAIALVRGDFGTNVSLSVAKEMVMFLHRAGGEAQFSRTLASQTRLGITAPDSKLTALPAWIAENLTEDLSVDSLAKAVGMTRRTFVRQFGRWHGGTPAKLVEDLRVETACRWLEDGRTIIKHIAHICGFGDEERMRRTFLRRIGIPPTTYRDRFTSGGQTFVIDKG